MDEDDFVFGDEEDISDLEMRLNLQCQVDEMDLLLAMYPTELLLDSPNMLDDIKKFLAGENQERPKFLSFCLKTPMTEKSVPVEACCAMGWDYPSGEPDLYIRCHSMDRHCQRLLNKDLQYFLSQQTKGQGIINDAILWLQENLSLYENNKVQPESVEMATSTKHTALSRMWLYSHHIYKKGLLERITDNAYDLDLTGFVLSGMPGIIGVEGYKENIDTYWQRLKITGWRKVFCKHRDDVKLDTKKPPDDQLRRFWLFDGFKELAFGAHGHNHYHMDLGAFLSYLKEHHSEFIYQVMFGIGGKPDDNSHT